MGIIEDARLQQAVYWPKIGVDEYGVPTYGPPVQLEELVRWDDVQEEFTGPSGDREFSNARVMVGREMVLGSLLMLGTISDIVDFIDPTNNTGVLEIRSWRRHPDLDNDEIYREATL